MTFSLNNITSFGRNIRIIPTLDVAKYGATDTRTPMTDSESETDSVVQVTSNSPKRPPSQLSSPPRPTKKHKDVGHSLTADGGHLTTTNGIHSSTLDSDLSTEIPAVIFDSKSNDASEVDSLLNDASGDSLDASDMVSDFKVLVHRCVDIVQTTGKNASEKKTALVAAVAPAVVAGGVTVIGVTALSVAALASHNADMKRIESSIGNVESSIGNVESSIRKVNTSIGKVHEDVALMAPKEDVAKVLQNQDMILKNQTECAQLFGGINVQLTTVAEEITDIKGHLESADKERASMKERLNDIDTQLVAAAKERANMNARLDGIDTQLAAAAQERASMKKRLDSIDAQLATAAQERATAAQERALIITMLQEAAARNA